MATPETSSSLGKLESFRKSPSTAGVTLPLPRIGRPSFGPTPVHKRRLFAGTIKASNRSVVYSSEPHQVEMDDARFRHLTHSNLPPSEDEILEIKHAISVEEIRLSAFEDRLDATEDQREVHRERIRAYKSTLSVVRRVPIELIAQILIFCCPGPAPLPPEPNTPQLVVTWICSRWRMIALSVWELWNSVLLISNVKEDTSHDLKARYFLSRLSDESRSVLSVGIAKEWLRRAGPLPLEARIQYRFSALASYDVIRYIVVPNSHRFRKLYIDSLSDPTEPLLLLLAGSVDLLEELDIIHSGYPYQWNARCTVLDSAPNLRRLTLQTNETLIPFQMRIPWSQLTYLHIIGHTLSVPGFLDILTKCTGLVECSLQLIQCDPNSLAQTSPNHSMITLPHLRTLSVPAQAASFFQYFTLPALEDLTIPLCSETLVVFVSQYALNLTTLTVASWRPGMVGILENTLRCTPYLTSLELHRGVPSSEFLAVMGRYEVLPKLQSLFLNCDEERLPDLVAMIECRRSPAAGGKDTNRRLEKVRVGILSTFRDSDVFQTIPLDRWRRGGLDIDIQVLPDYVFQPSWETHRYFYEVGWVSRFPRRNTW